MKLKEQIAVITGGGTGIGLGIAQAFAEEGCTVVITGRRAEPLQDAVANWDGNGRLVSRCVDVSSKTSVRELFDWVAAEVGDLEILVNSAGTNIPNRTLEAMEPEQWDDVMAINASGAYYCMHEVMPGMRQRGSGLVINISSISGVRATALGGVAYSASKFAMAALGIAAANEVNAHGVRVTNIYPGEVNTPILEKRPQQVSDEHRARMLKPSDLGHLALSIATLPATAHVPEVTIKPLDQDFS